MGFLKKWRDFRINEDKIPMGFAGYKNYFDTIEKAIEDVCTKMVAIDLLMNDDRSVLIPEGTQNVDLSSKIQLYRQDIDATLPRYIEVVAFE